MLRTLIRRLALGFAWLTGVAVVLLLLVIAINGFDRELTPEAITWLAPQAGRIPAEQNAYYLMLALEIETDQPLQVGQSIAQQAAERQSKLDTGTVDFSDISPRFGKTHKLAELPNWQGLTATERLAEIYRDAAQYRQIIARERPALARYYRMTSLPAYENVVPLVIQSYSPRTKLRQLVFADQVLRLQDGDPASLAQLLQDLSFWTTVLDSSNLLIDTMVANSFVRQDIQLLDLLVQQQPALQARLAELGHPALERVAKLDLPRLLKANQRGELRYSAEKFANLKQQTIRTDGASKLAGWFLQRHAMVNDLHEMSLSADPGKATYCEPSPHWLYNPAGKMLNCLWQTDWEPYTDKLAATQQSARQLATKLEATHG